MKGIYILTNSHLEKCNTIKIGMSMRLEERVFDYDKVFSNNKYLYCYKTELSKECIYYIEQLILSKTELYRNTDFSSEYRLVTINSVARYHNIICETFDEFKIPSDILENPIFTKPKNYKTTEPLDSSDEVISKCNPFMESKRELLQSEYLTDIEKELDDNNKVLCVAPTGFGKTRIFYELINAKKFVNVIIFVPRKKLKEQTIEDKYTSILNKKYAKIIFDGCDEQCKTKIKNNLKYNTRTIICSCYQSSKQLCELIKEFQIDIVIFDEAHFIQKWCDKEDNNIKYFLESEMIKYRLFATATPTEQMIKETRTFGSVINKVKVYELINYGILCNIETIVKKMSHAKNEYHNLYSIICEAMVKYKKRKGIIYANTQANAKLIYNLFKEQQDQYNINSYLYISESNHKEKIDALEEFEDDAIPSVIITCKKIDYGYDNVFIDFICFADPKQGDIDIRQTMGRGLRNNVEQYPNKILHVLLPIYPDETNHDEYKHVIAYLRYMIEECNQDIIAGTHEGESQLSGNKHNIMTRTYDGDDIPTEICKMLCTNSYHQYTRFMQFLRENNVCDEKTYNVVQTRNTWMPLFCKVRDTYKKFCFRDLNPCNRSFYWEKNDCDKQYKKCYDKLYKIFGDEVYELTQTELMKKINLIDKKIPNYNLELYYPIK